MGGWVFVTRIASSSSLCDSLVHALRVILIAVCMRESVTRFIRLLVVWSHKPRNCVLSLSYTNYIGSGERAILLLSTKMNGVGVP